MSAQRSLIRVATVALVAVAGAVALPGAAHASCSPVAGVEVCTTITPTGVVLPVSVTNVQTGVAATHHIVGEVDAYRFTLSTGGSVVVPCVVLTVNAGTVDPCGEAGGTFVSRTALLLDRSQDQPSVTPTGTLASASVCTATITVTVADIGVEEIPAYSVC